MLRILGSVIPSVSSIQCMLKLASWGMDGPVDKILAAPPEDTGLIPRTYLAAENYL